MTEWIISSSVLIAIIIAMRTVLKGRISLRLQYALWGLVLIRLLVPVSFFSSPVSVMNVVPEKTETERTDFVKDAFVPNQVPELDINNTEWIPADKVPHANVTPEYSDVIDDGKTDVITPWDKATDVDVGKILTTIWIAGMILTGAGLLVSNVVFAARLRRSRISTVRKDGVMVYVTEAVATPCLFGIIHPAIYVTPEVVKSDAVLRHVLEHEMSHKRRGDNFWSVLRAICLVVHWYNPLVWLAAELSRRDGELACDEATIKRIGEAERMEYGRTLIGLTCSKRTAGTYLVAATTMTGSKKSIKERIKLIAKKPQTAVITLIVVILAVVMTVGFTFSGAKEPESVDTPWNWAQTLTYGDVESAVVWKDFADHSIELAYDENKELVRLLNGLEKGDFTENVHLRGGTSTYGLILNTARGKYNINEAIGPSGSLEIRYGESQWWIDDEDLSEFIRGLTEKTEKDDSGMTSSIGYEVTIPEEYVDEVIVYSGEDVGDGNVIVSVYSKAIVEAYAASGMEENDGMGWIFSIVRYDQDRYNQYLTNDSSGELVFAKDDEWYYCRLIPTDVRIHPTANEADKERWLELNSEMVTEAVNAFITRNGLKTVNAYGGAKPLALEDAKNIVYAELQMSIGIYEMKDTEQIEKLMGVFSSAKETYATKCSFRSPLFLSRDDGEVFVIYPAEDGCTVFMTGEQYFEYDRELGSILDMFGAKTHWEEREYNDNHQVTKINYISWGQTYGTREYVYDAAGNCLKMWYTDGNGEVTERIEYIYDSKGRLIERRLNDNLGTNRTVKYTYDDAGNLTEQMSYDENGDKYIRYSYTYENGRCSEMEFYCYADGGMYTEKYEYGKWSSPVKVATYNEKGKLNYWHEYEYDDKELCTKEVRYTASGKVECSWTYEYDLENNLKTTSQYDGNGNFIEKWRNPFEFGYDPTGMQK